MRRYCGLALVLVATLLCAAACGSGGTLSLDPVAAAATKTSGQGGKFEFTMSMTGDPKNNATILGDGVFDDQGTTKMDMVVDGSAPVTMTAIATTENGDDVFYLKSPLFQGQIPGGKTWVRIDMTEVAKKSGHPQSQLPPMGPASDPTQLMNLLEKTGSRPTKAGTGKVAGVDVTRYHADMPLRKLLELNGMPKTTKLPEKVATATIPVEVSIDSDGYLRAVRMHLSIGGGSMTIDLTVDEIGPQQIAVPSSDDSFDATDKLG
jgi:predicted small lipoprotein YifL